MSFPRMRGWARHGRRIRAAPLLVGGQGSQDRNTGVPLCMRCLTQRLWSSLTPVLGPQHLRPVANALGGPGQNVLVAGARLAASGRQSPVGSVSGEAVVIR